MKFDSIRNNIRHEDAPERQKHISNATIRLQYVCSVAVE